MSNKLSEILDNTDPADVDDIVLEKLLMLTLRVFKFRGLGNPFNYNRAFEWLQAKYFGFILSKVGGGSDGEHCNGIYAPIDSTGEFKATKWLGLTKAVREKVHSFAYNGTSFFKDWNAQMEYCRQKIMRDPFHFWTITDYDTGKFVKTFKVPAETVSSLLMPKWENSWKTSPNRKDPRIGGSVSTNDLNGENFEIIHH